MEFNTFEIDWEYLLERIERFLDLGEEYLTRKLIDYQPEPQLFQQHLVFRWIKSYHTGYIEDVAFPDLADHANLIGMDDILDRLCENTDQFVHGLPCNNMLLRGEPGSGKQAAIKGLLKKFSDKGLRLIEIHTEDLHQLPQITSCLRDLPHFFILLCNDLFRTMDTATYRELKSFLQGGIEARAQNVLVYATSPRTPMAPIYPINSNAAHASTEEKQLTAEHSVENGFGIILNLPPTQPSTYLEICHHLVQKRALATTAEAWEAAALAWAEERGRYTGLTACQFIDDLTGKILMKQNLTSKSP